MRIKCVSLKLLFKVAELLEDILIIGQSAGALGVNLLRLFLSYLVHFQHFREEFTFFF